MSGNLQRVRDVQADPTLTNSQKMRMIRSIMDNNSNPTVFEEPSAPEYDFPDKSTRSFQDEEGIIHGCSHYQRKCKVLSPCCSNWVVCRLCHGEVVDDHEMNRKEIKQMLCMLCQTEQAISGECTNCKEEMATYFCSTCNLLDSTPEKDIYHCEKCGICRIGKQGDYFHCDTCNICLNVVTMETHRCLADSLHQNCPICCLDLFSSVAQVTFLACGHPIHVECFGEAMEHTRTFYKCPLCQKAASKSHLEAYTAIVDAAITANPMPEQYVKDVPILCNECNTKHSAPFHFYGMKCPDCNLVNTSIAE